MAPSTVSTEQAEPESPAVGLDPAHIMQVGMGFWPAKTLLSAVELELFTRLGTGSSTGEAIGEHLGLDPRGIYDFLDTGKPQNEIKHTGAAMFDELYSDSARLELFMKAMQGISLGNFSALAETFDFSRYQTVCDVGGATGQLSMILAARHPHLRCTSYDLPVVAPIARKAIEEAGLADRVAVASGDFFEDPLPRADVITMSLILHDWNLDRKKRLIAAAYDALPDGGALIAIENLIDDARRENAFGLMMSLNMLIEFGDAFDYTGANFAEWCREAGFRDVEILPLAGPASAAIALK